MDAWVAQKCRVTKAWQVPTRTTQTANLGNMLIVQRTATLALSHWIDHGAVSTTDFAYGFAADFAYGFAFGSDCEILI